MKRTVGTLAGLAALSVGAYLGGYGWAQRSYAQAQSPLQTRIALINLGQVIKNYKKYQGFELELKQTSQTVQRDIETKRNQATGDQKEMERPDVAPERRDQLERDIKRLQREMQDSVEEAKQRISKREFDQLVQTYREVKAAVDAYARAYAIELVLQYSDAVGADVYAPPHFQHKLANRACIPIYNDPRMDLTDVVTNMLNQKLAAATPQR